MKIALVSDLHLEFWRDADIEWLAEHLTDNDADIIVNAGDTHPYTETRHYFNKLLAKNKELFDICGNHDFYHSPEVLDDFVETDKIVGACLWTDFWTNSKAKELASRAINDYRLIGTFDVDKTIKLHNIQKSRIFASEREIVVTHFPPSKQAIVDKFKGDPLNPYFVNDMDDEILNSNKKLWMCGHSHAKFAFMVGECRVVSNPLGYPNELYKNIEDYQPLILEI